VSTAEAVEAELARLMVELELGITAKRLKVICRQGPTTPAQRARRALIDERLLDVGRAGANLDALALAMGVSRRSIGNAIYRAKVARGERPRHMSRRVATRRKQALLSRDGAFCRYCLKRFKADVLTIDHVVPLARGGSNDLTNLVLACEPCNKAKSDKSPTEWKEAA
jgi:HNH endonuclease